MRTRMPNRVIHSDAFSSFLKGRIARESSGIRVAGLDLDFRASYDGAGITGG